MLVLPDLSYLLGKMGDISLNVHIFILMFIEQLLRTQIPAHVPTLPQMETQQCYMYFLWLRNRLYQKHWALLFLVATSHKVS